MATEIRLELDPPIATISLAAPERRNALTPAMAQQLIEACEAVDADQRIGAVVVRADGDVFCAGGDRATLTEIGTDPAETARFADLRVIYEAFARVGRIASPTIAAARGAAVGAGLNLLLATDARVVANDARLFSGFLPIGLHPGGGHFTLLARSGGREVAAALGLFGEELTGADAAARGLAWAAVRAEDVDAVATELAHRAGRDPELARAVVSSMRLELGPPPTPWPVALEAETARQIWSLRRRAD